MSCFCRFIFIKSLQSDEANCPLNLRRVFRSPLCNHGDCLDALSCAFTGKQVMLFLCFLVLFCPMFFEPLSICFVYYRVKLSDIFFCKEVCMFGARFVIFCHTITNSTFQCVIRNAVCRFRLGG